MNDDLYRRIRTEVAELHGVLLERDDPILITVTLNELAVNQTLAELRQVQEDGTVQFSQMLDSSADKNRELANKVLTKGLNRASSILDDRAAKALEGETDRLKTLMADALQAIRQENERAQQIRVSTWIAAGIALLSAIGAAAFMMAI